MNAQALGAIAQLATVQGSASAAEKAGAIVLALLAAGAVLVRPPRVGRRVGALLMLATLVLAPVLLAIDIWHTSVMRHLRDHPALAAGAIVVGLLLLVTLALTMRRWQFAFPLAAVLTLPFRIPLSVGGTTANLLIPLYVVIAAGALAHLVPRLMSDASGHGSRAGPRLRDAFEALLVGYVVLYAIQAAYSPEFSKALQNLVFFYVPFALMFRLLLEVRWSARLLRRCFGVVVALAALFVAIGFVEFAAKDLLLNSSLVAKDVYGNYFRVNSLFYDPNIYGRFLALVMVLLAAATLFAARRRRELLALALALAWLWAGLVTSISQTSMVALLLGLVVLAAFRWSARWVAAAAAIVLLAAVAFLLAAPSSLHFGVKGKGGSLNNASSGRVKLVEGGLKLFAERPLQGFGSGSFAQEYRSREVSTAAAATSASHTTPITIAAEQGAIGLIVYLAVLVLAFLLLFGKAGRSPPEGREASRRSIVDPYRGAIAACFAALVLHTMAYADFLEDPTSWALLGIGLALAGAAGPARAWRTEDERGEQELAAA
ncbi:MAG: O-antigen ligase family protein [Solirubrobacteraceae bacterium]